MCFQEVLDAAETKLPMTLRTERKLRIIGRYFVCQNDGNEGNEEAGARDENWIRRKDEGDVFVSSEAGVAKTSRVGWRRSGQREEHYHQVKCSTRSHEMTNVWAVVSARKSSGKGNGSEWKPYLRSLSLGGYRASVKDHVCGLAHYSSSLSMEDILNLFFHSQH